MSISIPKPNLLRPRVPSLFVVGLLVAQFLLSGSGNRAEPNCALIVERPHYSTHLNEYKRIDAIKLNITSTCNVPQRYTEITSSIQKIKNNREVSAHNFVSTRAIPSSKSPNISTFKNLFAKCDKGTEVAYSGTATGYVHLQNGQKISVSGSSGKFVVVSCLIGAQ
jgi:hypothetical protein